MYDMLILILLIAEENMNGNAETTHVGLLMEEEELLDVRLLKTNLLFFLLSFFLMLSI